MAKTNKIFNEDQLYQIQELKTKGDIFSNESDFSSAIEQYNEALKIDHNNENVLYNKGMCQFDLLDFDGAMITFERLVKINPKDDGAIRWLAKTYFENGLLEWALEKYQLAVKLNNQVFYYFTELAQVYIKLGQDADAIDCYQKASELEKSADIYFNLGKLYYENRFQNWDYLSTSLQCLTDAVELNKNNPKSSTFHSTKNLLKIVKAKNKEINQDNS